MPRIQIDLTDDEWRTVQEDYQQLRAQGWGAGLGRDEAGQRFGRAALLTGGRLLATNADNLHRAAAVLRHAGQLEPHATDGQAAAAAVGWALSTGLARMLESRRR